MDETLKNAGLEQKLILDKVLTKLSQDQKKHQRLDLKDGGLYLFSYQDHADSNGWTKLYLNHDGSITANGYEVETYRFIELVDHIKWNGRKDEKELFIHDNKALFATKVVKADRLGAPNIFSEPRYAHTLLAERLDGMIETNWYQQMKENLNNRLKPAPSGILGAIAQLLS